MTLAALEAGAIDSPEGVTFPRMPRREDAHLTLELVEDGASPEAYRLRIRPDHIHLSAGHALGLLQGARTLLQWMAAGLSTEGAEPRALPCEDIQDEPALARRGVMLDISRDRVPRMDFLLDWIERLAFLKVNEIQLYTEHTFAYEAHGIVWSGADPITGPEISELATFCSERGIDLVPNQQSLGHMHRWLKHPTYLHLAERPEGIEHPFSTAREPYGLAPASPDTLPFLEGLYAELLPRCLPPVSGADGPFLNGTFNIGLDEVQDLGTGRSNDLLLRQGRKGLFCGHLKNVAALAAAHGRRVQFWADEILNDETGPVDPATDLPAGAMPLVWGYEADYPWERACTPLSATEFYVCPGTSAWNSFLGRPVNARANLIAAAEAARTFGAVGMLITDWGDRGHHQPPTVSDAPLALGLSLAWNPASIPASETIHSHLDRHVYGAAGLSAAVEACGAAVELPGIGTINENPPSALLRYAREPLPHTRMPGLDRTTLESGLEHLHAARVRLEALDCPTPESTLARAEVAWAARLTDAALHLGLARLAVSPGGACHRIPTMTRAELAHRFAPCLEDHGPLWRTRSREGGRKDSARKLLRLCSPFTPAAPDPPRD
jgi:hypothetical protein